MAPVPARMSRTIAPAGTRAWRTRVRACLLLLRGSNPELDDQSPLLVIAQLPVDAAAAEVIGAVHAFLEGCAEAFLHW